MTEMILILYSVLCLMYSRGFFSYWCASTVQWLASASAVFISNMLLGGCCIRRPRRLYRLPAFPLCAMQWKSGHATVCPTCPNSSSPHFFCVEESSTWNIWGGGGKSHKQIQEQVKNQQTLIINFWMTCLKTFSSETKAEVIYKLYALAFL